MNIFHALILGIIEGLTEFLPVLSTAHLIITSKILGLSQNQFNSFFEVFIQSGAILAVIFLYWKLILDNRSYLNKLLISFIPTALIGLIFHKMIKEVFFNSMPLIAGSLFVVGVLFIITEKKILARFWSPRYHTVPGPQNDGLTLKRTIDQMTYSDAFIIGLIQATAIIPGVSRAGAVIIIMLLLRYKRKDAAIYSFLLAVPTILAASMLDAIKTDYHIFLNINNLLLLSTGFIMSFVTAFFVIKWFIYYLQKNNLVIFGVYRIILGLLLII